MKNFTFAHALAVIAGAFPLAQQLLPALVPPPWGIALGAIIGILGGVVHASASTPASTLPPPSAGTVAKLHLLTMVAAIVMALTVLAGCASLSAKVTSPTAQPYVTAAAQAAVGIAESQGITAAQINSVATQALAADQGTGATLAAVSGVISTQLAKLKLNPAELLAASALESALAIGINQQISGNATVAAAQAAVADILSAVIAATAVTSMRLLDPSEALAVLVMGKPQDCIMLTSYPSRMVCE